MEDYQGVFQRYEKKYMLTREQYQNVKGKLEGKMVQDQYGKHTICNLYFDTEDFDLIRTSLEKPLYKEKLRLRSYGIPKTESQVFVEIKKKYDSVVYKRRIAMTLREAYIYLNGGTYRGDNSQIRKEIDWFLNRYPLEPAVFIAYDRIALCGKEDANLRITFDENIRFRQESLELTSGSYGRAIIEPGTRLMEVKIAGSMPIWMSRLLSEEKIFPVSFSKYGNCYNNYMLNRIKKGGQNCA